MPPTTEWRSAWLLSAFLTIAGWLVLVLSSHSAQKKVVLLTVRNQAREIIVEALRAYGAWCSQMSSELMEVLMLPNTPKAWKARGSALHSLKRSPDSSSWYNTFEEYAVLFPDFRVATNQLRTRGDCLKDELDEVGLAVMTMGLTSFSSPEDEDEARRDAVALATKYLHSGWSETLLIQQFLQAVQDQCLTELGGHRPDRIHARDQVSLVRCSDGFFRLRIPIPGKTGPEDTAFE